jgi:hypothetical protein
MGKSLVRSDYASLFSLTFCGVALRVRPPKHGDLTMLIRAHIR